MKNRILYLILCSLLALTMQAQDNNTDGDQAVYIAFERSAQFPGGDQALVQWLSTNVVYPPSCLAQGVEGRVIATFVVEKDGSISDVQIMRSPDDRLSAEARRVILSMPHWQPATMQDQPVRCRFTLPIMFRLPDETQSQPQTAAAQGTATQEPVVEIAEVSAQFPGGEQALRTWISQHLTYPKECREQGITGRVLVSFIVEKDGTLTEPTIQRSSHDSFSAEAIRLVQAMPRWQPARQGDTPVRQRYTLPVIFRL